MTFQAVYRKSISAEKINSAEQMYYGEDNTLLPYELRKGSRIIARINYFIFRMSGCPRDNAMITEEETLALFNTNAIRKSVEDHYSLSMIHVPEISFLGVEFRVNLYSFKDVCLFALFKLDELRNVRFISYTEHPIESDHCYVDRAKFWSTTSICLSIEVSNVFPGIYTIQFDEGCDINFVSMFHLEVRKILNE